MMHRHTLLAGVLLLVAGASSAQAPKPRTLVLRYTPEGDVLPAAQTSAVSRKIAIGQITDARGLANPMAVGENQQRRPIQIVASTAPTAFALDVLTQCFKQWGIPIASDGELVLSADLVTLFAVEANKYRGEARLRFHLSDQQGNSLWEGITAGEDFTWGRDLNAANYNQVLSNALRKAYAQLVENKEFQAAWAGKAAPTADRVTPDEIKVAIVKMMTEGIGVDVLAGYVRSKHVSPSLTPDQIADWKAAGIDEEVIAAALPRP